MTAGYSGTPLVKKLGIKEGAVFTVLGALKNYRSLLGKLPKGARQSMALKSSAKFIHFFTRSRDELLQSMPKLKENLAKSGMLWVSWPKKSSGVETDLTDAWVRRIGLEIGLVDVKVCAVDETWSGLKFVFRLKD